MIKYALGCAAGHAFESWFPDSAAYEKQRKRGLVGCPECGSIEVDKAIMAPAVLGVDRAVVPAPAETLIDDKRARARQMISKLRQEIEANTDDVGREFPELARAIHDGSEPERAIRGHASLEEAKALVEDGIGVMPMPLLADELN
jgi:hypothetical protein